jgi:hypothetical protein
LTEAFDDEDVLLEEGARAKIGSPPAAALLHHVGDALQAAEAGRSVATMRTPIPASQRAAGSLKKGILGPVVFLRRLVAEVEDDDLVRRS